MKMQKGLSLIELLVVVSILGVLTSVVMVAYGNYQKTVGETTMKADAKNVARAFKTCIAIDEFSKCDDFSKPKLDVSSTTGKAKSVDPYFCAEFKMEIRGENHYHCIEVNKDTDVMNTTTKGTGTEKGTCKTSGQCE